MTELEKRDTSENGETQARGNEMIAATEEAYTKACELAEDKDFEGALELLEPLLPMIRSLRLPTDTVWMDFDSFLDGLVFQDYYAEEIGDRQIGRHPMKPSRILYMYGGLLIETGHAEKALEPLEMLTSFDPVCPKFLFELGEAYKRTERFQDAYENALWAVSCASNPSELARCYRDLAFCLSEMGSFEDAMMLNLLSLSFEPSKHAETEILWIRKKTGISPDEFDTDTITNRCDQLEIPVGISSTVSNNIDFLESLQLIGDRGEDL